jgi:hypothetical protein
MSSMHTIKRNKIKKFGWAYSTPFVNNNNLNRRRGTLSGKK